MLIIFCFSTPTVVTKKPHRCLGTGSLPVVFLERVLFFWRNVSFCTDQLDCLVLEIA
jgi:hypothetical protein